MEMPTKAMRFVSPAIVHKAPVVIPVGVITVALLIGSSWIGPGPLDFGSGWDLPR
jgi:hypothetical protein